MDGPRVNRREVLAAGVVAGAGLALQRAPLAQAEWSRDLEFGSLAAGDGWPNWTCGGVANLRREGGHGVLEAGSDVFPCDPRPVAFAVDQRFRDGQITAVVASGGAGAGVVLRRTGPRSYYAAIVDDEQHALLIVRRTPDGMSELARAPLATVGSRLTIGFRATGNTLEATADTGAGLPVSVSARDAMPASGDPGVLATARTLYPSEGPPVLPALGNLHLLPYGVQEGEAVIDTAVGQELLAEIRERSSAVFERIAVRASGRPGPTRASVAAATNGAPLARGAILRVASDVPARVEIEYAFNPGFRGSRRTRAGSTNSFDGLFARLAHLPAEKRVYWRARLRRRGRETIGPTRSFRPLPRAGSGEHARVAIGACAAQFGPIFDHLVAQKPDAFVWQGDLNYPDTIGPLAQTVPAYAGIWRDFLANPRMAPLLEHGLFAAQRDDHDYGVQDANSTNLVPQGIAPWNGLMERRLHYRFSAGLADFWVLDQRHFKSDPTAPDTPSKTLLGRAQPKWLLRTLAASHAPFKVICSPCTLAPLGANRRDGSWAAGFNAERDLLLQHIRKHVGGRTLFVSGDTHWTMVYDRDGLFEARPCPLGIPTPNDITLTSPQAAEDARGEPGVVYADDNQSHFAVIDVGGDGRRARLDLKLVREDGVTAYRRRFEQPVAHG